MQMWEGVIFGLVVSAVSATVGWVIKSRFFTKNRYLPEVNAGNSSDAYATLQGEWHEYHYHA